MTPEQLDAIQARHKVAEALKVKPNGDSHTRDYVRELEASAKDVPALLAYARDLEARLDLVRATAARWHQQYKENDGEPRVIDALDDEAYKLEDIVNGTDFAALTATEGQ